MKFVSCAMPFFLLFCCCQALAATEIQPPRVATSYGLLEGHSSGDSSLFQGIPYAQPPVGELRWQPPQPPSSWSGVRQATRFGPACPQARLSDPGQASEDCLTLNIAAPINASKLPVLFSIHGGGFVNGSGNPLFGIATSLNAHDIIIVTLNYRMGALGFFAHPELDLRHGANFGLLDMVAALRWVHDNIAAFGGDPNRITIQGVSAGGKAVDMLMVNREAKGLFSGAIAQSGYGTWPLQPRLSTLPARGKAPVAETLSMAIAAKAAALPAAGVARKDLYALTPAQLFMSIEGFHLPIIDGISLPEETAILFAQGQQHPVPFIGGGTSFDGSVYPRSGVSNATLIDLTNGRQREMRQLWSEDFAVSEEQGFKRFFGDIRYLYSGWRMSRDMQRVQQPGYLFLFDYLPPSQRKTLPGAPHGSDAAVMWTDYDGETAAMMRDYWMNFIKTGDPNGPGLPRWQTANGGVTTHWLLLAEKVEATENIRHRRLQFLDQLWLEHVGPTGLHPVRARTSAAPK